MQTCLVFGFSQNARSNSSKVHTRWWFLQTLATRSLKSEVYCLLASYSKCQAPAIACTPLRRLPLSGACHHIPSMKGPLYAAGYAFLVVEMLANQTAHLPEDLWELHTVLCCTVVCKAERDAQQRSWSCGQHQQNALHLLGAGSTPDSDVLRQHKSKQLMPAWKMTPMGVVFSFLFHPSFYFLMPAAATATAWPHIGRP